MDLINVNNEELIDRYCNAKVTAKFWIGITNYIGNPATIENENLADIYMKEIKARDINTENINIDNGQFNGAGAFITTPNEVLRVSMNMIKQNRK